MPTPRKPNPRSGRNAKSATSKNGRMLARRTFENLSPKQRERRDQYVEGLLRGLTKREAAIFAGVPDVTAYREGANMYREPYVQEQFVKLREKLTDEQLLTRAELVLNVKALAFSDDVEQAVKGTKTGAALSAKVNERKVRTVASALLAKIMGLESATKAEINLTGSVMEVPLAKDADDWEAHAAKSQEKLKQEVKT